jgi:phosphatidate cytidylyltransferase
LAGRAARASSDKNVALATFTGIVIAALVLLIFKLGTVPVMILIVAALFVAAAEAYASFRTVGVHPATLLGLVGVVALAIASYNRGEAAVGLVSVLFVFFAVLWYMGAERKVDVLDGIGATIFIFVWVGVFGAYAALLVSPINYPNKHGLAFLIAAILVTVANDVGALFTGRAFGRHPLAPNISPGKTIEGLVGGAVASVLVAVAILPEMSPWSGHYRDALIVGVALAIVVPIGDLFESMVKRTLGVKDMGELLPGHGGMLDRVDGLLFALPTMYYLVHVVHLG